MLDEPEQGLPDTAEFGDLVEDEDDGLLDAAIGILLEPVADLHEADRGSDDEFAAPGLLIAGRQGTVAQKIELILVEAALRSQQQPVVALTRRIDRLLIDQHGIDDAAHLAQLLPVTPVAGEMTCLAVWRGVGGGVAEARTDDQLGQRLGRLGGQRLPLRRLRRGVGRVAEQIELTCIAVRMAVSGRRAHGHLPDSRRESPMLSLNPAIAMVRQKPTSHPAAALPRR